MAGMIRAAVLLFLGAHLCLGQTAHLYWIEPCGEPNDSECKSSDPELAEWALLAWQEAAGGALAWKRADKPGEAQLLIRWVSGREGLYGEARMVRRDGRVYVEIAVRPDMKLLGAGIAEAAERDPLLRETIVYLTCLHETGHALGLPHTDRFEDIMYSFGYGGDIVEYFGRYRRNLKTRADIQRNSGIAEAERKRLVSVWKAKAELAQ
jgi:hypothetical protein